MKSLTQFITEAQSSPSKEWMEEMYAKYNEELFNNELPKKIQLGLTYNTIKDSALGRQGFNRRFVVWKDKMRNGMYIMYLIKEERKMMYYARNGGIVWDEKNYEEVKNIEDLQPFIEINPRYKYSDFQKEDTLIHEMIHLWVSKDCLEPKRAHGKEFKRKCDEIRAKAEKLYGVKYKLTTYASHEEDEDKDYQETEITKKRLKEEMLKMASRGGGVYSIYWTYDKDKMKRNTMDDIKMLKYTKRFIFCTKNKLNVILKSLDSDESITNIYVSDNSYIPMCEKFGKFSTMNSSHRFWDANDYSIEILMKDAKNLKEINEGLGSKIKNWLKRIFMGGFIVKKGTNVSNINFEDVLNYAEELENEMDIEIKGDQKNDKKLIDIEK